MNHKIVWRITTSRTLFIFVLSVLSLHYVSSVNDNIEEYINDSNGYGSNSTSKEAVISDLQHNYREVKKMSSDTLHAFATNISDNQIIIDMHQTNDMNSYLRRDIEATEAVTTTAVLPSASAIMATAAAATTPTITTGQMENFAFTTTHIPEYVQSKSEENVSSEKKEFQLFQPQMTAVRDKQQHDEIIDANNATNTWMMMMNYEDDYRSKEHKNAPNKYDGIAADITPIALQLFSTREMRARNGRQHNGDHKYNNENDNGKDNDAETIDITDVEEEKDQQQQQEQQQQNNINNIRSKLNSPIAMAQHDIIHEVLNSRLRSQILSQNDSYDYNVYDNYGSDEEYSSHDTKHSSLDSQRYNNIVAESISQEQLMPPSSLPAVMQTHEQQQYKKSDQILMNPIWTTPSYIPTTTKTSTYKFNSNSDELVDDTLSSSSSFSPSSTSSSSTFTPSALAMTTSMVQPQKKLQFQPWVASVSDKRGKHIAIPNLDIATTTIKTTAMATTLVAAMAAPATTSTTTTTTISTTPTTTPTTTTTSNNNSNNNKNNNSLGRSNNNKRRLLPHEQLRNYIDDAYIRMPVAVIVDPAANSLEQTKTLWNEALPNNINIKIILVSLNGSGIPAAFSFNNGRQFLMGLNSIKERTGNGDAFVGLLHAAELVPYDSAIFISAATLADYNDLVQDAAITLLKKRIRVYLLWYGEKFLSENETQESVGGILGEVALRSGGEILHILNDKDVQEIEGVRTYTVVAEALRGSQELDIPTDTTLSSLHIKNDKEIKKATLDTANGG